jgi:hypothetical protein
MFQCLYEEGLDYDCRHFTWDAEEEEDEDGEVHHWDYLKCLAYFVYGARQTNPGSMPEAVGGRSTAGLIESAGRGMGGVLSDF